MDSQGKLAGALLGGYLLGRTKKGGFALRLATRMAVAGTGQQPGELVRDNLNKLLASGIVDQLREQAMEAAKAALDARIQGLTENLNQRTASLKDASGAAQGTADKVTGTLLSDGEKSEDEGEEPEPEPEPEEDEEPKGKAKAKGKGKGKKQKPEPEPEDEDEDEDEPEEDEPDEEPDEEEPEEEEPEEPEDEESDEEPDEDEDEESDEDERERRINDRASDLHRKRISTLRRMGADLGFDEQDLDEDKPTLARWIAEAEVEDEEESDGEEH